MKVQPTVACNALPNVASECLYCTIRKPTGLYSACLVNWRASTRGVRVCVCVCVEGVIVYLRPWASPSLNRCSVCTRVCTLSFRRSAVLQMQFCCIVINIFVQFWFKLKHRSMVTVAYSHKKFWKLFLWFRGVALNLVLLSHRLLFYNSKKFIWWVWTRKDPP